MSCDGIFVRKGEVVWEYSCHVCVSELPKGRVVRVDRERWDGDESFDIEPLRIDAQEWSALTYDEKWDLANPGAEGASRT